MRGLYPIVDLTTLRARGLDPLLFAEAILRVRPSLLQLRAKDALEGEVVPLLRALAPRCRTAGTLLVANDHVEWALAGDCDYVHVGQDDRSVAEVRALAPNLRVGVSTHTIAQLSRAIAQRPDYLAYGPVFATRSKARPDPTVGIEGLRAASKLARAAAIPLVAIGGITRASAAEVCDLAECAAVIAELLPAANEADAANAIAERARTLHAMLSGHGA